MSETSEVFQMLEIIDILLVAGDLQIYFPELRELAEKFHKTNNKLTKWRRN